MATLYRSLLNQLSQISGSNVYTDTLSMSGAETSPDLTLQKDLNFIRTQLKTITGAAKWYTSPVLSIASLYTGISGSLQNIFSFTGMTDRNDSAPTYSSTTYVVQGSSLETAIGALDAAVAGVSTTKAVTRLSNAVASGSAITIPGGYTYTLSNPGGSNMDVYLNGQLMQANTGTELRDYLEDTTSTIKFTFAVNKNSYVAFLIRA